MIRETKKRSAERKVVKKSKESAVFSQVKEIIEKAKSEKMYDWLVGLDSPGPVPRDAAYYRFLYLAAKELKLEVMVDLGTCEGVSAMCMAKGNPEGSVITVDLEDKVDDRCRCDNIKYCIQDAMSVKGLGKDTDIELLYIDIVHTPEAMETAFKLWSSSMTKGGIILLDGVTWTSETAMGMPEWWEGFNPKGFTKHYDVDLHPLENAGTGIFIKD